MNLETSIEFLKGIGPDRAKLIKSVYEIATVEDFLNFFPYKYQDRTTVYKVSQLSENLPEVQLFGEINNLNEVGAGHGKRLHATFSDGSGTVNLVWFQYGKWLKEQIPKGKKVLIFGKVNVFNGSFSISHPEIELVENRQENERLVAVYPGSEKLSKRGLGQKFFRGILKGICANVADLISENLPDSLREKYKLISRSQAYFAVHFPQNLQQVTEADRRLKFEEAFFFQLGYALKKQHHHKNAVGNPMQIVGDYFNHFYNNHLPFDLTNAQKRVLKEIRKDMSKPVQMNRLLQGDVGSGKTMVAVLSMLIALDNGFQSVLMAPTEILAQQHFTGISELLAETGVNVRILTGSTKTAERKIIHQELLNGTLSVLVGTHAVLEDAVKFRNLGLAIIDEQHRFGVAQRARLWAKNNTPPHILIMTATPIPRTLAMSFYSDLDLSVIDEMPVGRKPIITAHRREHDRTYVNNFCKDEIRKGRQIYFVYPLIEESETLAYKNLTDGFEYIKNQFSDFRVEMLHGRMTPAEKEAAMQKFVTGSVEILVSTTVIEVGVNVPNASVMVIENAEKFGLSQLHQLRGRVGRGAEQSFCILMSDDKLSKEARKRLKTMVETNDGFKISEVDMQLRGPGDILGTQQSGIIDFKKLDLIQDENIIKAAKFEVEKLLIKDPFLALQENSGLKNYYLKYYRGRNKWSKIS